MSDDVIDFKPRKADIAKLIDEQGRAARFTFADLYQSDLTPADKTQAESVRVEGIKDRYIRRKNPSRKEGRVGNDVQFLLDALDHRIEACARMLVSVRQYKEAATKLEARLKQELAKNDEHKKTLVLATEGDLRRLKKGR